MERREGRTRVSSYNLYVTPLHGRRSRAFPARCGNECAKRSTLWPRTRALPRAKHSRCLACTRRYVGSDWIVGELSMPSLKATKQLMYWQCVNGRLTIMGTWNLCSRTTRPNKKGQASANAMAVRAADEGCCG